MTKGMKSLLRLLHLTAAQQRHLGEMLPAYPEDPPMVWTTKRGSAENRCAIALSKKGLLERIRDHSTHAFNYPAFVLTERGLAAAKEIANG